MPLVTFDQAKEHLKLPDDIEVEDVERKIASATAIVLIHIRRTVNAWNENTDPNSDYEFAIVQACILEVLGDLYRRRGDDLDERMEQPESGPWLRASVRRKLHPLRMPTLA
jgi:hypothetical protein